MILQAAAMVSLFGLFVFAYGHSTGNPGLAMLGAIIIIGVGGMGAMDGYQYQTGEIENVTENNTTVVETQYANVDTMSNFPLGIVVLLTGTVMLMTGAGDTEEI